MAQSHETFHQLYCTYAPAVRRFAIMLAGNSDDADDIVAEILRQVPRNGQA